METVNTVTFYVTNSQHLAQPFPFPVKFLLSLPSLQKWHPLKGRGVRAMNRMMSELMPQSSTRSRRRVFHISIASLSSLTHVEC